MRVLLAAALVAMLAPEMPLAVDAAGNAFVAGSTTTATVGLYNPAPSTFFLRTSNNSGIADLAFPYGPTGAGWIPLVGDWTGQGKATVGLYDPLTSTFYLRNSNTSGAADLAFTYGPAGAGWIPLVGDWTGQGKATVGLYNPFTGTFFLRNSNTSGVADLAFSYGPAGAGWIPLVGDWTGQGKATVGLYDPLTSTFYLRNSNTSGAADLAFTYGPAGAGWIPLVGDWTGQGKATVGLYDPLTSTFLLRNSNTSGIADLTFGYGPAGASPPWRPLAGGWSGFILPQLPLTFLDTTYIPPSGQTIVVPVGGDFQGALNAANPGDVIILQAGATYSGNFTLPNKTGTGWIYIQSSALAGLPAPGTRVTPAQANLMPKLLDTTGNSTISTSAGAHNFRFVGIEITTTWAVTTGTDYEIVTLVAPGGNTSLSQVPTNITFDRCYIHGTPTGNVRRGIGMQGASIAVIDSYLSDIHEVGADTQAIGSWNGPGPFKIVNNELEAAGENVMFGGAVPGIPNLIPSDIEIRGNHFFKPLSWRVEDPAYAGIHWTVKNLFELKNAQRVLVDGNVFENNWADAQNGFAILFTVRGEFGAAPWAIVADVTFTHNIVQHVTAGFNISGYDDTGPSQQTQRLLVQNNLMADIGAYPSPAADIGWLFLLGAGSANIVIDHNTAFQTGVLIWAAQGSRGPITGFVFINNITPNNQSGVSGDGTAGNALLTMNTYFFGYIFDRNVIPGGSVSNYPPGNFFPPSLAAVGFVNLAGGDYHLAPTSLYRHQGTYGTDPGADIDALNAATARAISRVPGSPTQTVHTTVLRVKSGKTYAMTRGSALSVGARAGASYLIRRPAQIGNDQLLGSTSGRPGGAGAAPCVPHRSRASILWRFIRDVRSGVRYDEFKWSSPMARSRALP